MFTVLNILGTAFSALAPTYFALFAARCLVGAAGYSTAKVFKPAVSSTVVVDGAATGIEV